MSVDMRLGSQMRELQLLSSFDRVLDCKLQCKQNLARMTHASTGKKLEVSNLCIYKLV